jgi:hypothetical protein
MMVIARAPVENRSQDGQADHNRGCRGEPDQCVLDVLLQDPPTLTVMARYATAARRLGEFPS